MRVSSASGDFVELRIDGYEFGASSGGTLDGDDANGLFVSGEIRWQGESWSFRDPRLTTGEARDLLEWMTDAAGHRPESIEFLEPHLAFAARPETDGGSELVVTLSGEAAPPSVSDDARGNEGFSMTFRLPSGSLAGAADDWRRDIAAFPPR